MTSGAIKGSTERGAEDEKDIWQKAERKFV